MWQHELHPPYLINVAALPCESQNTKNVILQRGITKENCIRCKLIKVDQDHHVPEIYLFGELGYRAKRTWNKYSWHWRPAKTLWCKLVLTLTRTPLMLEWPSEIMCACWWWTLWMHALSWMFIYVIQQNILWNYQCDLMHVTAIL